MRILELTLPSADPAAQRAFWEERLDLRAEAADAGGVTLRLGNSRLRFRRHPRAAPQHFAINVPADRFEAAAAWLAARADLLFDAHGSTRFDFSHWDADAVYCRDGDGNIVELISRHALDNEAGDRPFGPRDLLEISEVGVVADDVPAAASFLQRELGAPSYRTRGSSAFWPLGDERGLFIVVAAGRDWFPDTGVPAVAAPVRAVVAADRAAEVRVPGTEVTLQLRPAATDDGDGGAAA